MFNYFEFYELPITFLLDEAALKRKFYQKSKAYHPDFHTLESVEKQMEILELSTINNEAYKTLSDFDKRLEYILKSKGWYAEEGKNEIPQDFLMEMMQFNETLMELEFDFNADIFRQVQAEIKQFDDHLMQTIHPLLVAYEDGIESESEILEAVKNFYFKRKYILKIQENLSKFASL